MNSARTYYFGLECSAIPPNDGGIKGHYGTLILHGHSRIGRSCINLRITTRLHQALLPC